ncbi:hypothetical protein PR202_gb14501 [Eleusine coracana subsp. coracana]|uniref:RBR-type E3 ubiquitin transferase n=1 Tax=Eleusine coracana subsp. coracana TaxID=191504 RepID=A0AAV5EWG8_ELECO|nr:hypothetical protein PR202_gb14501 [Eleusine coracana subsp. coracana]
MAGASAGPSAASPPALDVHRSEALDFSAEASSSSTSSTSRTAELKPGACEWGGEEEDLLDLDSPWVAAAEVEAILEEKAAAAAAAALKISGEEEQDEDEIRDNQQRQEDELMALEAIYGDDLAVLGTKGGLRYFQIYIQYDVANGIGVCAKFSSNAYCKNEGCSDGRGQGYGPGVFSYNCNFEYLPPLILTCLLPRSYPSKDPPYFIITVKWMDGPLVSQLCEMLDTIWAELPGQEVVYQWVEWLRNSSRSHIWSDGMMTLGPDIATDNIDYRVISRKTSLDSVIPMMLTYSSKKRQKAFLQDVHMCTICLNQSKGSNFIQLSCQHLFCMKCMETLCKMHVKEGSVFQLVCPGPKCNASIPPHLLKKLLSKEEFERWDRLTLKKALDSMSDVVYCPRCGIGCLEDESNNAQCPECFFIFCSLSVDFLINNWRLLIKSFIDTICSSSVFCFVCFRASGRMSLREMEREMLTIQKLCKDIQLCPKCRMPIVKSEGCNKMSCGNCGQLLCFRCGRAISGYDHFWSEGCELFELRNFVDVTPYERHMEEVQIECRRRVQLIPIGSTVRCPKCRERNFKEDEKYIFCWACRIHYCSLCRMRIEDRYMRSGHYGSSECVGLARAPGSVSSGIGAIGLRPIHETYSALHAARDSHLEHLPPQPKRLRRSPSLPAPGELLHAQLLHAQLLSGELLHAQLLPGELLYTESGRRRRWEEGGGGRCGRWEEEAAATRGGGNGRRKEEGRGGRRKKTQFSSSVRD